MSRIAGGVIGAIVYDFFIGNVLIARGVPEAAGGEAEVARSGRRQTGPERPPP